MSFDKQYRERCLRSIGIFSEEQLMKIRSTKVAIGGLGLGGSIFINLVRLGFENFHVADPDVYERTNINRQRAAKETTIGSRKDDCLIQEARAINPAVNIKVFREGVNAKNVGAFLEGVDWVVDAVDVFAFNEKVELHRVAREKKLPVITCVAVGFGAACVVFNESTPSFEELAGIRKDDAFADNMRRFAKFVTPEIPGYMLDQVTRAMDRSTYIPFVVPGVEISAALVGTEMCKHIAGIGKAILAPKGIYFDPIQLKAEEFACDYRVRSQQATKSAA